MATKAQITAKINTDLASASNIPASRHRSVLHTDPDSILEAGYGNVIKDDNTSSTIFSSVPDIQFNLAVMKTFREINVNGTIKNIGTNILQFPLLNIHNDNYKLLNTTSYYGIGEFIPSAEVARFIIYPSDASFFPNSILLQQNLHPNETVRFSLTYPANL